MARHNVRLARLLKAEREEREGRRHREQQEREQQERDAQAAVHAEANRLDTLCTGLLIEEATSDEKMRLLLSRIAEAAGIDLWKDWK